MVEYCCSCQIYTSVTGAVTTYMIVERIISGTSEILWDSTTKKDGIDFVTVRICLVFIKSQKNKRIVHEVRVVEKRSNKVARPSSGKSNIRIVGYIQLVNALSNIASLARDHAHVSYIPSSVMLGVKKAHCGSF